MGLRLEGPSLTEDGGVDICSDGIVRGSVQVPGSGQPIVLMSDHQTVGGYAKIATVIGCDVSLLAQARPGGGECVLCPLQCKGRRRSPGSRKNGWTICFSGKKYCLSAQEDIEWITAIGRPGMCGR